MRTGILASMLAARGHEVLWWTSTFDHYSRRHRHEDDRRFRVGPNFEIQYLRGSGYRRNVSLSRLRDNYLVAARFSRRAELEPEPDIILASLPTADLAERGLRYAKARSIPFIVDVRDLWPDAFWDLVPARFRGLARLATRGMEARVSRVCGGANGIVGLTEAFLQWGLRHAGRERSSADRVFPMAYRVGRSAPAGLGDGRAFWRQRGIGQGREGLIVVFFGALGKTNDLEPVVKAASLLHRERPEVQFVLCGTGEREEWLRGQSHNLRNVVFPGWVGEEQIRALLTMADVALAPYVDWQSYVDCMGNKYGEYLSGGVPIALSLDRGVGFSFLQQHGCGFSYGGRAEVLAERLAWLASDRRSLHELKLRARAAYDGYLDADSVYSKMIDYLEANSGQSGANASPLRSAQ